MLTVTDAFKSAILPGTSAFRKTAARVTLNVSESTITYDTFTAVESEAAFSDVTKVTDGTADNTYRIATCEPNYWKLDGSTVFKPAVTIDVGYASLALCAADGTFTTDPAVQITTTADFTATGLTLFFDRPSGDYPIDFDIDVDYSVTPVNVYHKAVTGNDSAYYVLDEAINPDTDPVDTITITFKKMNKGYRRARLTELFMGFQQQYGPGGSDNMISIKTIQQIDITNKTLPYGQAILRLLDTNGDFNPLDPSGIAEDLQVGAKMVVEFGVFMDGIIEYVKTGTYWFWEWRDAGDNVVELVGHDTIGFYGHEAASNYYGSGFPRKAQAHMTGIISNLSIPSSLIDLAALPQTLNTFFSGDCGKTLTDEIRYMGQAICKIPVCDEDSVIRFIDLGVTSVEDIDLDDCYSDPVITRNNAIGGVDLKVPFTDIADSTETILEYGEAITGSVTRYFNIDDDWSVSATTVTGAVSYTDYSCAHGVVPVDIVGDGSTVTITITGYKLTKRITMSSLDNALASDTTSNRVVVDNPHMFRPKSATTLAISAFTLANYNKLLKFSHSYRGNPLLEMGDMVTAETVHGDASEIVTRQDITFDGTMSATMEGVG